MKKEKRSENIKLIIGADVFPTSENSGMFAEGNIENLIGAELKNIWQKADCRIFNLEGPLTNVCDPIIKSGPVLKAPEDAISGIAALKPSVVLLANNHILDHGQTGAKQTLKLLNEKQIPVLGIGWTVEERRRSYIYEQGNIRIGIYNCCEHEFSIEEEGKYGANPFDPLYSFDNVYELKQKCDFVAVLYHGGKELFRFPSPRLKRVFHKFAERGADAVIAQHTHCIGGYEIYNGSLLLYGQGNFIFDLGENEFFNNGILVEFNIYKNDFSYNFVPYVKDRAVIRLAQGNEKKIIEERIKEWSNKIPDDSFLEKEYRKKALEYIDNYLAFFHGRNIAGKVLNRILGQCYGKFIRKFFYLSKNWVGGGSMKHIYNSIQCEAHQELVCAGLQELMKKERNWMCKRKEK